MLAYTVGFGGSMIWFGSSVGVALSNMYPQAKNVGRWLADGWHVTLAYVIGFVVLLAVMGWQPTPKRGDPPPAARRAGGATGPGSGALSRRRFTTKKESAWNRCNG